MEIDRHAIKKLFRFTILIVANFMTITTFAQPLPTGPRLKDIGNQCKIGALCDDLNNSLANVVIDREFNLIKVAWWWFKVKKTKW